MFACHSFFFFNDTATTEIYTLSLHDALPISLSPAARPVLCVAAPRRCRPPPQRFDPRGPPALRTMRVPRPLPHRSDMGEGRLLTRHQHDSDRIQPNARCLHAVLSHP